MANTVPMKWDHNFVETGDDPTRPVFTTNPYEPPAAEPDSRQWSPMTIDERAGVQVSALAIAVTVAASAMLPLLWELLGLPWYWRVDIIVTTIVLAACAVPAIICSCRWLLRNLQ